MKYETEYQSKFKWFDSPVSKKQTSLEPSEILDALPNEIDKAVQADQQIKPCRPTVSKKLFVDLPEENVKIDKGFLGASNNRTTEKIKKTTLNKTKQASQKVKVNTVPEEQKAGKKISETAADLSSKGKEIDHPSAICKININDNKRKNEDCLATKTSAGPMHRQQYCNEMCPEDETAHDQNEGCLRDQKSHFRESVTSSEYKENFYWKFLKRNKPVTHPTNDILPLHANSVLNRDYNDHKHQIDCPLIVTTTNKNRNHPAERPGPVADRKHQSPLNDDIRTSVSSQLRDDNELVNKSCKRDDNLDLFKSYLDNQGSHRPACTEYSANFLSPTKFHVKDGGWVDDVSPQALTCLNERPDCNDWFKEVVRLRQLSYAFKAREEAGSFFKKYMQNDPIVDKRGETRNVKTLREKKAESKPRQAYTKDVDVNNSPTPNEETHMIDETTQTPTKTKKVQLRSEQRKTDESLQSVLDTVSVAAQTSDITSISDHSNSVPCTNKEDPLRQPMTNNCVPIQSRPLPFSKTIQPLNHYRNNVGFDSRIFPSSSSGLNNSKVSFGKSNKQSIQHSLVEANERSVNNIKYSKLKDRAAAGLKTNNYVRYNIISQRSKDPPSSIAMPVSRKMYDNAESNRKERDFSSFSDVDSVSSIIGTPPRSIPTKITNYDSLLDTSLSSTSSVANDTLRRALNRRKYF